MPMPSNIIMSPRPLLAAKFGDWPEYWKYSMSGERIWVSPKIDGIRATWDPKQEKLVSRTRKILPNDLVQSSAAQFFQSFGLNHIPWDGELCIISPNQTFNFHAPVTSLDMLKEVEDFNSTQSVIMSQGNNPQGQVIFTVFDIACAHPQWTWQERYTQMQYDFNGLNGRIHAAPGFPTLGGIRNWSGADHYRFLPLLLTQDSYNSFLAVEEACSEYLSKGFEGAMLRRNNPYKSGRSTLKEGTLVKVKAHADAEGTIIEFEELHHNRNTQERDAFGLAKRMHRKAGMEAGGTLGALVLQTEFGVLRVGTGFDMHTRQKIWDNKEEYLGKTVTFTYMPVGMQELPRAPVFKGFRMD